jgi:sporulation protein YlmC with PRC-barrel domain
MLNINIPIALNAKVECLDGPSGQVVQLIINPVAQAVTHLVVQDNHFENSDKRLVPLDKVISSEPNVVCLGCTKSELSALESFTVTHYIRTEVPDYNLLNIQDFELSADPSPLMALPYAVPMTTSSAPVEEEQIPAGEIDVRRGAVVEATDGTVGRVDEFLLEPTTDCITHLVLREKHLWATKEIVIPVKAVERMSGNTVLLKLDKQAIAALPEIPIHRNY